MHTSEIRRTPWGYENVIWREEGITVKIITVHKGQRLSQQYHWKRDERWVVLAGEGLIEVGGEKIAAKPGVSVEVKRGTVHRLGASKYKDIRVLETSFGEFDQEGDIVRLEDDYGRV